MHIFTFNWLTLTSEMRFVKFHPEVASCLLSRGKRKYAPLGMRLLWKYINYFLVYHLISHFLLYLQNYKEFEAEILDLQSEKYGLSFDIKKYTSSGWALGGENRVRIRRYRIAKCDTISTNCYAFAQDASQKVRRIVLCGNEWIIAPLTSVKNSCWSMFSKPKSSNFKANKFVQLNIDRWLLHQNIAGKTPTI